ncbi:MAG TPA: retropepsin-like aspartic protease [Candidatus Elarobacter sp.]|jgi:clan AA aspartic protease (TIGR02281 family)|nr:retropepsin-like aspartic protease [Candidatus Elarobacter sp.]
MRSRAWRLFAALIFALPLLRTPAPAAEPVPDAATIRAKVRAAVGDLPDAYRETDETTSSTGTTTVEHDFRRGKDVRFTYDAGRFHTEHGIFHAVAWHMNDNGQVVIDEPDPGEATAERVTTTVTAVHTPVEGYVIATLNARGQGTKDYVDAAAWQYVRRERIGPRGAIVATYDDIRADHGRTFAHHVHVDNGAAHTTSDLRIVEYVSGDVDPKDVAMPKPRRALVEFPPGVSSVDLPTRFGDSHVYVRVNINGRGLDFVLDSGASGITIDRGVARELGLPEFDKHSAVTAGRYETARTIIPEMRVGELVMHDVAVQEVPQGWNTADGVKEVGLLGFDFLAELGVTLDYEHQRVTVVPSERYVSPNDPHTIPIDVRIGSGQPLATVSLNGALGERWILDTGGAGTFLIFDYFARRHPEALHDVGAGLMRRTPEIRGIGGAVEARPYQIASIKLGNVNFADFVGYVIPPGAAYAQRSDGLIGTEFLKLFTLGFDYANSRIYLVPNKNGRAAMGIKS